jgi:hypothetical protein
MSESLNARMQFDHVVEVHPDGTVTDAREVYAPDAYQGEPLYGGWSLMDGYSGQYGYSGPWMHQSEYVGGRLERDILATPGYYVTVVDGSEDDPDEWAVAYKPTTDA